MSNKLTLEQQQFATENHNLIYGFLNKHNLSDEEWYGVAALGLLKAVKSYNGMAKFSTFAYKCMLNEVRLEFKYRSVHNPDDLLSLDYEYASDSGDAYTLADIWSNGVDFTEEIIDNCNNTSLLYFFESRLRNDLQRKIFGMLITGIPIVDIAKNCDVSKQYIYLLRKNLIAEYRKIFNDDGQVRKVNEGQKIRIANNPYMYKVGARNDRYIVCHRKYNNNKSHSHVIIDLEHRIYGEDNVETAGRYNTDRLCKDRLEELINETIKIDSKKSKKLDFYVA